MMAFVTFYALLVVVFACLYRIADLTTRVPQFSLHAEPARISFVDSLYYSVATITTLGFGDIAPASLLVRAITGDRGAVGRADAAVRLQRDHAQRRRPDRRGPHDRLAEPRTEFRHAPAVIDGGHGRTMMGWHGRRVLVTGGAGFLGSNLCHALARARRARHGARRLPVRRRRQPGEPGRCGGGTGARRHPRDRPAHRCARAPR